jgi:hypothetical protein
MFNEWEERTVLLSHKQAEFSLKLRNENGISRFLVQMQTKLTISSYGLGVMGMFLRGMLYDRFIDAVRF